MRADLTADNEAAERSRWAVRQLDRVVSGMLERTALRLSRHHTESSCGRSADC